MKKNAPRILITGGSGLVGQRLSTMLREKGYNVAHLSRKANPDAPFPTYRWDIASGEIDPAALQDLFGVVHLAGAGIADARWSPARKQEIISSRVDGLQLLHKALSAQIQRPQVFVSASAIGYYGNRGDEYLREDSPPQKDDFLSETCQMWEAASEPIQDLGVRLVKLRIGIVLSTHGGALAKMLPSYAAHVATYFGNGRQWYSWIHIDDLCRLFIFALENQQMQGTYNAASPQSFRNQDFALKVAEGLDKKCLLVSVPLFALRLAFGQMADVVLQSCKTDVTKTLDTGFVFSFPELPQAIKNLVAK